MNRQQAPWCASVRAIAFVCVALYVLLSGCHTGRGRNMPPGSVQWMEKPWTREAIELNEYLYLETKDRRQIIIPGPQLVSDAGVEYVAKRDEPERRVPLADVTDMGACDMKVVEAGKTAETDGPPKQTMAASFLAIWGAVILFIPSILVILLVT